MSMQPWWKGHDFPKDKERELLNFKPMGKSMCQLLNPFSCHPPFWLTHISLSHQSNTTLKPMLISWDSYCSAVVCGRNVSPCPHAHSTNGLSLHVEKEAKNSILSFLQSSIASPKVFPFGHIRTWPSTKATLIPFASNADMERRFLFSHGTNNTVLIFK